MKLKILFFVLSLSIFYSCSDIFEHNLSKDAVEIYSPGNNARTSSYSQQFWWKAVDNSLLYRLQIATPAFDSMSTFILDSVTTHNKLIYSLKPGKYQWRVRAENGSSFTAYTTYNLQIDTGDVTQQTVSLLSPLENTYSNLANQQFSWQEVFGATDYNVTIDSGGIKILDSTILAPQTFMNFKFKNNQSYNWNVRAGKSALFSIFSSRVFTYDSKGPDSTLVMSSVASGVSNPVTLTWNAVTTSSDVSYYIVNVYGPTGTLAVTSPNILTGATLSYSFYASPYTNGIKYTWEVIAYDNAGNKGTVPSRKSFILGH